MQTNSNTSIYKEYYWSHRDTVMANQVQPKINLRRKRREAVITQYEHQRRWRSIDPRICAHLLSRLLIAAQAAAWLSFYVMMPIFDSLNFFKRYLTSEIMGTNHPELRHLSFSEAITFQSVSRTTLPKHSLAKQLSSFFQYYSFLCILVTWI